MDAQVTVTIYTNQQCTDCTVFDAMLPTLQAQYRGRVKFIHRDFPSAKHAWARVPVEPGPKPLGVDDSSIE